MLYGHHFFPVNPDSSHVFEENPILLKSTSNQNLKNLLLSAVARPCLTDANDSNFVLLSYNFLRRLIFLDFFPSLETSIF